MHVGSGGGSRSASIASSSRESRSQAFEASILSWIFACSSRTFSISSGERSSPSFAFTSSYRVSSALIGATPSSTFPSTVFAGSSRGSCCRNPMLIPSAGNASPMKRRVLARHDAEQRALPRAVQPEHADLRAEVEREPDVLENPGVGRMDLPETLHGVDELRHRVKVRNFRFRISDLRLANPDVAANSGTSNLRS